MKYAHACIESNFWKTEIFIEINENNVINIASISVCLACFSSKPFWKVSSSSSLCFAKESSVRGDFQGKDWLAILGLAIIRTI